MNICILTQPLVCIKGFITQPSQVTFCTFSKTVFILRIIKPGGKKNLWKSRCLSHTLYATLDGALLIVIDPFLSNFDLLVSTVHHCGNQKWHWFDEKPAVFIKGSWVQSEKHRLAEWNVCAVTLSVFSMHFTCAWRDASGESERCRFRNKIAFALVVHPHSPVGEQPAVCQQEQSLNTWDLKQLCGKMTSVSYGKGKPDLAVSGCLRSVFCISWPCSCFCACVCTCYI